MLLYLILGFAVMCFLGAVALTVRIVDILEDEPPFIPSD